MKIYIPFTKRDEDQRTVQGYATTEALDSQGEVVSLEAVQKALPEYLRFPTIREMHQLSAVGRTMQADIDSEKKGLIIMGKIVDDNAWKKVKEGVYNGFSIGGKMVKKVGKKIEDLILNEISLVDRPANPEAVFTMIKIDKAGHVEEMQNQETDEALLVGRIIDWAKDVRYLINSFESEGKSTQELYNILNILKSLAVGIFKKDDRKRFEKVLYEINFEELEKYNFKVKEEKENEKEIKKYVNESWTPGYFEQMKKALG